MLAGKVTVLESYFFGHLFVGSSVSMHERTRLCSVCKFWFYVV